MLIDNYNMINNLRIISKLTHQLNLFNIKTALHIGLMLFWAIIIIGTFKEFI
jgi:hypothetical protein